MNVQEIIEQLQSALTKFDNGSKIGKGLMAGIKIMRAIEEIDKHAIEARKEYWARLERFKDGDKSVDVQLAYASALEKALETMGVREPTEKPDAW